MGSVVHLRHRPAFHAVDLALPPDHDREYFWVPLLVVWLGSVARVGLALAHRAAFETEATLALACVMLLPLAAIRAILRQRASPPRLLRGRPRGRLSAVR